MNRRIGLRGSSVRRVLVCSTSWLLGGLLFCLSLLIVAPPPHYLLWQLSIPVQEWGYWLVPVALSLAVAFGRSRGVVRGAGVLAALAVLLLLLVPVRAALLVGRLPEAVGARLSIRALLMGTQGQDATPRRFTFGEPSGVSLVLDYYAPLSRDRLPPLVVVIHGGGWRGGAPTSLPALNHRLAARGIAVAAITYRFTPAHRFPAALDDVHTAVSYLRRHAGELAFDSTRIVLLGRSAGAHLALLAAYTTRDPSVRGVISFYGPTDLSWAWEHPSPSLVYDSRGTLRDLTGGTPADRPDVYVAASPVSFLASAIPTLLVHGALDPLVSVEHSRMLADSLRRRGKDVTHVELPWATHGCDFAFNGPCGQISTAVVERFVERISAN
jgi:acetyl esterase/lipase